MPSGASPRPTSASAARTFSAIASFFSAAAQTPSFSSAALAYLPAGTARTSPTAMRPSPASLAMSKPWPIVDVVELGILRRDQHQPVAEQVDAGVVLDELLLLQIIHPVEIGRGEHVGRRALLDLLGQRRACGEARHRLDAGGLGESGVDVVDGVLHRGRGEHGEGLVLRAAGCAGSAADNASRKARAVRLSMAILLGRSRRPARGSDRMDRPAGIAVPDFGSARTVRCWSDAIV